MEDKETYALLNDRFQINHRRFLYLKKKFSDNTSNLHLFIENLQEQGCIAALGNWYDFEPAPEFFLFINEDMKKDYAYFGDCVRFDVTYNLCRLRSFHSQKWNVGLFSGFSEGLGIVLFGILLIKEET